MGRLSSCRWCGDNVPLTLGQEEAWPLLLTRDEILAQAPRLCPFKLSHTIINRTATVRHLQKNDAGSLAFLRELPLQTSRRLPTPHRQRTGHLTTLAFIHCRLAICPMIFNKHFAGRCFRIDSASRDGQHQNAYHPASRVHPTVFRFLDILIRQGACASCGPDIPDNEARSRADVLFKESYSEYRSDPGDRTVFR
jgi:hypothetical protein